jgi:hypothetical protein
MMTAWMLEHPWFLGWCAIVFYAMTWSVVH